MISHFYKSFVFKSPNGERGWNTGPKSTNNCSWDNFECTADPDEGHFIADIIEEVRYQGANGNIYVIGNSNGAALAYRLASNAGMALPIRGIIAKVTQLLASPERSGPGVLNYNQPSSTRSTSKVSVLSIMGTADGLIPYEGGTSSVFGGDESFQLMSVLDSMQVWASHNGCSGIIETSTHISDQGDGTATKYDYKGCPSDIIIEHYAMHGAGHNAGGGSIDGDKIDYVVAYDFIERLENGSVVPTPSPVSFPMSVPTSSCTNNESWTGKFNATHTCDYVAESPTQRCGWENSGGVKADVACPAACDTSCITTTTPVTSPVSIPTISTLSPVSFPVSMPTSTCINDESWTGKFNASHTCDYVAESPTQRCGWENSGGVKADVACPAACDTSCTVRKNRRFLQNYIESK